MRELDTGQLTEADRHAVPRLTDADLACMQDAMVAMELLDPEQIAELTDVLDDQVPQHRDERGPR